MLVTDNMQRCLKLGFNISVCELNVYDMLDKFHQQSLFNEVKLN